MMSEILSKSLNEKDVENTYRHYFLKYFNGMDITSPFGCDGYGVLGKVKVLMEFKDDINLHSRVEVAKVLSQLIFYVKKFYDNGKIAPTTLFVGDKNECFAIHVNDIYEYLKLDINWGIAPSSAHTVPELMLKLMEDESIRPFIYTSDDFKDCLSKVKDLSEDIHKKVLITDRNITEVFKYFDEKVLGRTKLKTNEIANLFVQILVNKEENYLHPIKRRKTVVTKGFGEISILSREGFESFFKHFDSSYSPSQKDKLAAVVDRIVEDTTRRKQGEFFTPSIWVDKAHEYISSVYGEDWKEEFVVWDPAWGTGNLTRDYKFKELFVSTLNYSDIETANQMNYNPEAVKFQFDFLNDDYDFLPKGLRSAIEGGRQIIVLMNPPYGTATDIRNISSDETKHKEGTTKTQVTEDMRQEGIGKGSEQLYTQFFYKLTKIGVNSICMFSTPLFLSGNTFGKFREKVVSLYDFKGGFIMDSKNFADVKSWGLSFSIFKKK